MDFMPDAPEEEETGVIVEQQPQEIYMDAEPVEEKQEDALTVFNKEWNAQLDEKRTQEAEHELVVKQKGTDDLENWTQQREIRLNAKKESNRSEEQVLLETLEGESDGTNSWERVMKLIDATAEADGEKVDITRMRKLFIQLKNEPIEKTRAEA